MTIATTLLATALYLIADEPGRGEDLSGGAGVLTIVGIALVSTLLALGVLFLIVRLFRRRRATDREARTAHAPLPSEEGRPWSSER